MLPTLKHSQLESNFRTCLEMLGSAGGAKCLKQDSQTLVLVLANGSVIILEQKLHYNTCIFDKP